MKIYDSVKFGPERLKVFQQLLDFSKAKIVEHGFIEQAKVDRAKWTVRALDKRSYGGRKGCSFNLGGSFTDPNSRPKQDINYYRPGSQDYFSFAHKHSKAEQGFFGFREYARFWTRTGVGSFYSKDLNEVFLVLIAHELAHFVNYSVPKNSRWYGENHKDCFLRTYFAIRQMLLGEYKALMELREALLAPKNPKPMKVTHVAAAL